MTSSSDDHDAAQLSMTRPTTRANGAPSVLLDAPAHSIETRIVSKRNLVSFDAERATVAFDPPVNSPMRLWNATNDRVHTVLRIVMSILSDVFQVLCIESYEARYHMIINSHTSSRITRSTISIRNR